MKRIVVLGMVLLAVGFAAGCGSSSSTTDDSDAPTITSISALPKATSPMASASASVSRAVTKAATTGLNLLSTSASTFSDVSTQSRGACEMVNQLKEGISGAMQADMIQCFMGQMDAAGAMPGDVNDGVYHVANLPAELTEGDSGTPSRVKVRVVKDATSGTITDFKMFMCKKIDSSLPVVDSNLEQSEYTSMTITGTAFTMRAVGKYTDSSGGGYGWHSTDVTGVLNSSGAFVSKNIVVKNIGSWGGEGNFNWQDGTLIQLPGSFTFYGYRIGSSSSDEGTSTWQDQIYGAGQMIGDTSAAPANLAMGDGAMSVVTQGTYNSPQYGGGEFNLTTIDAWLGDGAVALSDDTQSLYYNTAHDGTLPTPVTGLTEATISTFIAFGTGETWDCTDDTGLGVETIGSISEATVMSACSQYGQGGGNWIQCYLLFPNE